MLRGRGHDALRVVEAAQALALQGVGGVGRAVELAERGVVDERLGAHAAHGVHGIFGHRAGDAVAAGDELLDDGEVGVDVAVAGKLKTAMCDMSLLSGCWIVVRRWDRTVVPLRPGGHAERPAHLRHLSRREQSAAA